MTQQHEFADMKDDLAPVYAGNGATRVGASPAAMIRASRPVEPMTRAQWQATRAALVDALSRYDRMEPSCKSCIYLDASGWCAKWEATPPPEYQASGCDAWEFDGVPF